MLLGRRIRAAANQPLRTSRSYPSVGSWSAFAWLGRDHRLRKDYEGRVDPSEAWIYIAMARRMLKQLTLT